MIPMRVLRSVRQPSPAVPPPGGRKLIHEVGSPRHDREDLQDKLGGLTDRGDLERLFDRRIGVAEIVRLLGHEVSRDQIVELLESPELHKEIRKILS